MSYNVFDAIKDEVMGTAEHLSKEQQQQRLDICHSCSNLKPLTQSCGLCGCFVKLKTKYWDSECDAEKWPF